VIVVSSDRSSNKSWQERCFVDNHAQIPLPLFIQARRLVYTPNADKPPKGLRSCRYHTELRTICRHPGSLPGPASVSRWRTCSFRSPLLSLRKRSRGKEESRSHRTLSFTFRNRIEEANAIRSHRTKLLLNQIMLVGVSNSAA
jgi:hypothetical protein